MAQLVRPKSSKLKKLETRSKVQSKVQEYDTGESVEDITEGIPSPLVLDSEFFGETSTDNEKSSADVQTASVIEQDSACECEQTASTTLSASQQTGTQEGQNHTDTPIDEPWSDKQSGTEETRSIPNSDVQPAQPDVSIDTVTNQLSECSSEPQRLYAPLNQELERVHAALREEQQRMLTCQPFSRVYLRCLAQHNQLMDFLGDLECERNCSLRRRAGLCTKANRDPLGELLAKFLSATVLLRESQERVKQHAATCTARADAVWTFEQQTVDLEGVCVDAARVTRRVEFETAQLNEAALLTLRDSLAVARDELLDTFVGAATEAIAARAAIDMYLDDLYTACPVLSAIPDSVDVHVRQPEEIDPSLRAELDNMLRAIGTLMAFLRRPHIRSVAQVYADAKRWLLRLCATVLRAATAQDHLALLIELVHLPNGMLADWAACLFQPLVDAHVSLTVMTLGGDSALVFDQKMQLCIAALALLCTTFPEREQLLDPGDVAVDKEEDGAADALRKQNGAGTDIERECDADGDGPPSGSWCLLDSDGNAVEPKLLHSVLGETDLLALFSQIPMHDLLKRFVGVQLVDGHDFYQPAQLEPSTVAYRMQQALAVFADLFTMLDRGVRVYVTVAYNRACNQLSKFVLLAVRTLTRHWLVCRAALADAVRRLSDANAAAGQRLMQLGLQIQLEFERQFALATSTLMCARKLVGWKRLRKLPFDAVSRRTNDRLVRILLNQVDEQQMQSGSDASSECAAATQNHAQPTLDQLVIVSQLRVLVQRVLDAQSESTPEQHNADNLRCCFSTFANVLLARATRCSLCTSQSVANALDALDYEQAAFGPGEQNSTGEETALAALRRRDPVIERVAIGMMQVAFELSGCTSQQHEATLAAALVNAFSPLANRYPALLSAAFLRLFTIVSHVETDSCDEAETDIDLPNAEDAFEAFAPSCNDAQKELLVRLCRDAPWNVWHPDTLELRRIERWLLAPLTSLRQRLVQLVLERLDLDDAPPPPPSNGYFLSRAVHRQLCSLLLRAASHHLGAWFVQDAAAANTGSVRWALQSSYQLLATATQQALSNLVTFLHRQKFTQHALLQQFNLFLWTVLLRLKLHPSLDRFFATAGSADDDMAVLRQVPQLRESPAPTPFHAYAKLMLCGAADSVEQFANNDLDAVQQQLDAFCHMSVLHTLFIVVQHFNQTNVSCTSTSYADLRKSLAASAATDCGTLEPLLRNERFRLQIFSLTNADQALWAYYMDMLKIQQTQFPGPVVMLWAAMLRAQLAPAANLCDEQLSPDAGAEITKRLRLISFWTRLLVSLNSDTCEWFRCKPILYLLNTLAELAFLLRADDVMLQILYTDYIAHLTAQQQRETAKDSPKQAGALAGMLQWLARPFTGSSVQWPDFLGALLKLGCRVDEYAYLIRLMQLVSARHEDETHVWAQFAFALCTTFESSDTSVQVDLSAPLSSAMAALQLDPAALTVENLCAFRWIELLGGQRAPTPDHPLFATCWLHFFERLFQLRHAHSLFRTVQYSTSLQKSLRKALEAARDLFADRAGTLATSELNYAECERAARLQRLFQALVHWIDEPRLLELNTDADYANLPPAYFATLLARVRRASVAVGAASPAHAYLEYVDTDTCEREVRRSADQWHSVAERMRAAQSADGTPAASNDQLLLDCATTCCDNLDVNLAALRLVSTLGKTHKRYRRPPRVQITSPAGAAYFTPAEADVLSNLSCLLHSRDAHVLTALVDNALDVLTAQARAHMHASSTARTRDEAYVRDLRSLFKNEQHVQRFALTCRTTCRGPAIITQPIATKVRQDSIGMVVDENRSTAERFRRALLDSAKPTRERNVEDADAALLQFSVHAVCAKTLFLDKLINWLTRVARLSSLDSPDQHAFVQQAGTKLFYRFLKLLADDGELAAFAPTHRLIDCIISTLGEQFISTSEHEASNLLRSILDCANDSGSVPRTQPITTGGKQKRKEQAEADATAERNRQKLEVCSRLAPHFVPSFDAPSFLSLFKQVNELDIDRLEYPPEVVFVLLSKFEVRRWLARDLQAVPISDRLVALHCVMEAIQRCGGTRVRDTHRTVFDLHARHFQTIVASLCTLDPLCALHVIFSEIPRRSLPPSCIEVFCSELRTALASVGDQCTMSIEVLEKLLDWLATYFSKLRLTLSATSTASISSASSSPSSSSLSVPSNDTSASAPSVCSNNRFLLLVEPILEALMNLLRFFFQSLWRKLSIALREQHLGTFQGVSRFWTRLELVFKPFLAPLAVPLSAAESLALRRSSADVSSKLPGVGNASAIQCKQQLPLLVAGPLGPEWDAASDDSHDPSGAHAAAKDKKSKRKTPSPANGAQSNPQATLLLERYAFVLGHFYSLAEMLIHDVVGYSLSDAKAIEMSAECRLEQSVVTNTVRQLAQLTWMNYVTFNSDMLSVLRSLVIGSSVGAGPSGLPHSVSTSDVATLSAAACVLPSMTAVFNLYHNQILTRFNWQMLRIDFANLRCLLHLHEMWSAPPPLGVNPTEYATLAASVLRFANAFLLKWNWLTFFRDMLTTRRAPPTAPDCAESQQIALRAQLVDTALQLLVVFACGAAQAASEKESTALLEIFLKHASDCTPLVDVQTYSALLASYATALQRSAPASGNSRTLLQAAACDRFAARTRVALVLRAVAGFEHLRRARSASSALRQLRPTSEKSPETPTPFDALEKCTLFLRMHFDALNNDSTTQFITALCSQQVSRDTKSVAVVRDCEAYVRQLFADLESCVPCQGSFTQTDCPNQQDTFSPTQLLALAQIVVDCVAQSRFTVQYNTATAAARTGAQPTTAVSPYFVVTAILECVVECNSRELLLGLLRCGARSITDSQSNTNAGSTADRMATERARRLVLYQLLETAATRFINLTCEVDDTAFQRVVSQLVTLRNVTSNVEDLLAANSLTILYCVIYEAMREPLQKGDTRSALSCMLDLLSGKLRIRSEMDERRVLLFLFQLLYTLVDDARQQKPVGDDETVQPACADLLHAFCGVLLSTEENSASPTGWFSSAKDNAKKNILSARFRIVLRTLYTFIVVQTPIERNVRVVAHLRSSSASTGGTNSPSSRVAAALRQLETMRDSRQYASYREVLQDSLERIRDPGLTFLKACDFLKFVVDRLAFGDTFKCIDVYDKFMRLQVTSATSG